MQILRRVLRKRPQTANVERDIAGRQRLFEVLDTPPRAPYVFVGDSITAGCEWRELLGWDLPILNRGIGGDSTTGLLSRIGTITALKPRAIFLMIGTNDLGYREPAEIVDNIAEIIGRIQDETPATLIYLQSILPSRSARRNARAAVVNHFLNFLCKVKQIRYVDLYRAMLDDQELLDERYTNDGLHLTGDAYLRWKREIQPFIGGLARKRAA